MSGLDVLTFLRELCSDMDEGRPLRRFPLSRALTAMAAPAALGLALSVGGCDQSRPAEPPAQVAPPAVAEYAAPMPRPDQDRVAPLPQAEYAAPMPEPDRVAPGPTAEYAAPMPEPDRVAPPPQAEYAAPHVPDGAHGPGHSVPVGPTKIEVRQDPEDVPVVVYGRPFEGGGGEPPQ